jgi:hypothetical protein
LIDVFWSRGYAGSSIEHLTEATGLLRGSLYATYGSKEDMFRVATARYTAALATDATRGCRTRSRDGDSIDDPGSRTARGCMILNAIPEAHSLSAATRGFFENGLGSRTGANTPHPKHSCQNTTYRWC